MVPSFPGGVTYGDTIEEAIEMAKEAIELYMESLKEHDEEIPTEEGTLEYTLTVKARAFGTLPKSSKARLQIRSGHYMKFQNPRLCKNKIFKMQR